MRKTILTVIMTAVMAFSLQAQQRICATMDHLALEKQKDSHLEMRMQQIERNVQQWIQDNPNYKNAAVITIPVVFHVLWNTSSQNISDARILAQLDVLNKDFSRTNADAGSTPSVWQAIAANTSIQFCMAQRDPNSNATNGIVRKQTSTTAFSTNNNMKFSSSGGDNAWPSSSYLNIWVCNMSGGILGYAQFPGGSASTDGVVLLYSSVGGPSAPGTATPYHLGRTATHEVGHWLNLYHIWGDDGTSCSGTDQVSDTPNQADENYGCPAFPSVSCSNGPNGDMHMNYMDYTNDACMNMFTNGQSTRMNATLAGSRVSLQSSLGCSPPAGGSCNVPSGLGASSITQTSATLTWSAATGAVNYNIRYRINGTATWTNTTSATTSKAISGLTAGTTYEFQVQTVCSASSSSFSSSSTFTTTAPACADNNEPNGSIAAAKVVAPNSTNIGKITPSGDLDYFKFTTTSPNTNIKLTLTNLPADYELRLYNSSGTSIGVSQNGGTTPETIKRNTTTATTYYTRVWGYAGANNSTACYTLTIQASNVAFKTMAGSETEYENSYLLSVYPNPVEGILKTKFNASTDNAIHFNVIDMTGRVVINGISTAQKGINEFEIDMSGLPGGLYFVDVNNGEERETQKVIVK